jgi:hypothetical protein
MGQGTCGWPRGKAGPGTHYMCLSCWADRGHQSTSLLHIYLALLARWAPVKALLAGTFEAAGGVGAAGMGPAIPQHTVSVLAFIDVLPCRP